MGVSGAASAETNRPWSKVECGEHSAGSHFDTEPSHSEQQAETNGHGEVATGKRCLREIRILASAHLVPSLMLGMIWKKKYFKNCIERLLLLKWEGTHLGSQMNSFTKPCFPGLYTF